MLQIWLRPVLGRIMVTNQSPRKGEPISVSPPTRSNPYFVSMGYGNHLQIPIFNDKIFNVDPGIWVSGNGKFP